MEEIMNTYFELLEQGEIAPAELDARLDAVLELLNEEV